MGGVDYRSCIWCTFYFFRFHSCRHCDEHPHFRQIGSFHLHISILVIPPSLLRFPYPRTYQSIRWIRCDVLSSVRHNPPRNWLFSIITSSYRQLGSCPHPVSLFLREHRFYLNRWDWSMATSISYHCSSECAMHRRRLEEAVEGGVQRNTGAVRRCIRSRGEVRLIRRIDW